MRFRWRVSGRLAALLVGLMMISVPAAAAVITQNFLRADVTVDAACFTKTAGADAASPLLTFTGTNTISGGGVDLLQETTQINGYAGDRLIYSRAIDFNNNCGSAIDVTFISQDDPAGGLALDPAPPGGVWDDMDVTIYLATVPAPVTAPNSGSPEWEQMLSVTAGVAAAGVVPVTMADGDTHPLAFVVDTDDGVVGPATGTIRWTAQALHP